MNTNTYRKTSSTRRLHGSRPPARRRRRTAIIGPKLVIHLLVGALALLTAEALADGSLGLLDMPQGSTQIVHAEQSSTTPATVSRLALSTSAPATTAASAPATEATVPAPTGVLNDLGSTIGRRVEPTQPGQTVWHGAAGLDMNLRSQPNRSKPPVGTLKAGTPVTVVRWVTGEEIEPANDTWAELADGTYVFSTSLRRAPVEKPPALPADAPTEGRWIDVNLTEQVATAYEGREAVKSVLVSTGRPGWDTPVGTFPVLRRLEKDTMDGATLAGQGPNGVGATYKVENVRWVQYFTPDGSAIHENYWRRPATFGMPGSHGCIGMAPEDSRWFWDFATVGTPVVIHE